MACIVSWIPSVPGPDGVVVADLDEATRYVMERLTWDERSKATVTVDENTIWVIDDIAAHYRQMHTLPPASLQDASRGEAA